MLFKLTDLQRAYYLGMTSSMYLGNISPDGLLQLKLPKIDIYKFEAAINKLVFRHEMLRAVTKNEEFGIILNKVPQIKINTIEDDREIDLIIEEIKKFSFDVNRFPGFRFILINKPDHDVLFFQGCLFFLDASSWSCFIHEVISAYEGKLIDEVTPSSSFVKFADSVSKLKYSEDFIKDLEYWKIKKLNYGRPEFFPVNNLESKIISPSFQSIRSDIAPYIFDSIKRKAKNIISTPTACLLGLYALIVGRWSNASNVAINIVASYKGKPRDVLGNYGFLLPLLVKNITTATTIGEFLTQVTHTLKTDLKHMSCSISDMVSHYPGGFRDIRAPLFPLVFTPVLKSKIISDFDIISGIKMIKGITKTPQVWIDNQVFSTDDGGFGVKWDYVEQLFERTTIEAMHKHYCGLINYLAQANWETDNFTELQLLSQDLKLINRANSATREIVSDTLFTYYTNNIIKNRLEDNIAVIDHIQTIKQDVISYIDNKYTYKQLLNNSELLARYILNSLSSQNLYNQFQPGELIAILSEKGYNQVVSSLAIMQAGFGYLPLNIDWPATRVNEVLIQGSVDTVLLSRKQYVKIGEQLQARYNLFIIENILDELTLDTELEVKIKKLSLPKVKPDDIAYVIFTSGSTGIPKGVTISHKGVLNTLLAVNKKYNVTARDKILALSEFSFDLSVYDIFGLLSEGGTIIFPEQDKLKDPIHWLELINRYKISIWNTVPQLAELLVHHAQDSVLYITSLRLFLLSGDWIPINLPALIKEVTPKASVLSLGGATEGSIWSIWYEINKIDSQWKAIPYGIAMPNQKMYVLSHNFEHCPPGVIGEIYIGGLGVALNYYNNKKMTAASFINHPVLGLVYKTGDMGLWSRRGYIKFGGRVDNQVKINGYRIELREIEIQLNKYPELKQAIVLVLEHVGTERNLTGNKYLAAYYVAESKLDEVAILNHLRQELPDYMVPDILIYLQNIPLTANGKLDRKLLPNPNLVDMDSKYIAPRDELDKSLIQVFANVLGLADDKLSINADFFKLGGNSILAIKLVTQINKQIARAQLLVVDIFSYTSVRKLADYIVHGTRKPNYQEIEINRYNLINKEDYKLSFQQGRIWLISSFKHGASSYNIPMILKLSENVNEEYLFKALEEIVKRHEVLRSIIRHDNNHNPYSETLEFGVQALINKHLCSDMQKLYKNIADNCKYVFKLNSEYPIKIDFYQIKTDKILSIVVHHIAFDGWSMGVLLNELTLLYHYYKNEQNNIIAKLEIAPLKFQYKDFALWQTNYFNGQNLKPGLIYWQKKLAGFTSLSLPLDNPRPKNFDYMGNTLYFVFDKELSDGLQELSKELGFSLYSILLSGFYLMLNVYSNQDDIILGTTVTNRNYPGAKNVIGCFVNILVLRFKINKEEALIDFLKRSWEDVIFSQRYQEVPVKKIIEVLNIKPDPSKQAIFQVLFNMLNMHFDKLDKELFDKMLDIKDMNLKNTTAKFDLTLYVHDGSDKLEFAFNYATSLFNEISINAYAIMYESILRQFIAVANLKQLSILKVKDINSN